MLNKGKTKDKIVLQNEKYGIRDIYGDVEVKGGYVYYQL